MARYRKIDPRIWNDEKFCEMTTAEKLVWFALLTHPMMTPMGAGCIQASTFDDLVWDGEDESSTGWAILHRFAERGLILWSSPLIIVKNFLVYNRPENQRSLAGWIEACEEMPRSPLFAELRDHLRERFPDELPQWLYDGLLDPLADGQVRTLKKLFRSRVPLTEEDAAESARKRQAKVPGNHSGNLGRNVQRKVSGNVPSKVSGNPPRYQEQEQEQELRTLEVPENLASKGESGDTRDVECANANIASAPPADSSPAEPVFIELPGLNGKSHLVTEAQVEHWQGLYPAVDVRQSLRSMKAWLEANPERRKKRVARFIVSWLNREQDRGGRNGSRASPTRQTDQAGDDRPPVIELDDELIEAMAPLLAELDCRDRRGRPLVDYGTTCKRIGSWLDEHGHRTSDELVQAVLVNWTRLKVAGSMEAQ